MTGVALGCSHTAGIGINPSDCYVSVLSQMIGQSIDNLSQPGASHSVLQQKLVQALQAPTPPSFVIAQWPNPIRRITWQDHRPVNENINCASPAFNQLLRQSQENFYQPWLDTIIICNLLCKALDIIIINIMIEDVAEKYHAVLANHGVVLHVDKKLPGETWLMDSAAADNLHHSAQCHAQWAQRLHGLLNEYTTR